MGVRLRKEKEELRSSGATRARSLCFISYRLFFKSMARGRYRVRQAPIAMNFEREKKKSLNAKRAAPAHVHPAHGARGEGGSVWGRVPNGTRQANKTGDL